MELSKLECKLPKGKKLDQFILNFFQCHTHMGGCVVLHCDLKLEFKYNKQERWLDVYDAEIILIMALKTIYSNRTEIS